MRRVAWLFFLFVVVLMGTAQARANEFGQVRGVVHDPQHRPIGGAKITLRAAHSYLTFSAVSNRDGAFEIAAVPLGDYVVTISDAGFSDFQQTVTVNSQSTIALHFQLTLETVNQSVTVQGTENATNIDSVTPETQIDRIDIARTPGADRTNSLAMITDFVPGTYMTHDMLHMRGGHELSWLIDGVFIPNTNIASNIGPQIDPKDIDTLEVDRGSYSADLGDRTYGMFNVVPRSGFERNRDGELVITAGNFFQTNDQISLGDHTERFAWYASLNGNRSDYGLQPAVSQPVHDAENGYGGFASLVYNHDSANQLRLTTQLRTDYYQIPKDPDPNDWESSFYNSSQLNDGEHETDSYAAFTWLHTFSATTLSQVSPFFHYNSVNYQSSPNDMPVATTVNETGLYAGGQASISTVIAKNSISAGIYGYAQHENDLFGLTINDGTYPNFPPVNPVILAGVQEAYLEDNYKPTSWLTLIAGERQTHFQGTITENAIYPRLGIAVQIPKLNWVFRGFYGHFYQPPPLTSISGPLLNYALSNQDGYVPLKGERNEEHQFGVQIPFRGWVLDADTFQTQAKNFLDHNNIGESSVFIPITVQGALIQAWELTIRSPHLWRFGQAHLSYSNQIAQQIGGITGGLTCVGASQAPGDPCYVAPGYSALDHDQRNTLNVGFNGNLPYRIFGSFNVYYGSGFSNGDQQAPSPHTGPYLPSHTTADLALGKDFGQKYTVSVNMLNVGNTRVLLDNSLTFGGFHYNDPRQIYGEFRYRFKF
ncbi:TonB-dependent receptor [Granulicella sp. S156]|uniref:TonB-dependent receptor n=1 Tax=Granulicella sp. S156 TaxID=1747224 RepID=UPI00131BC8A4|nr:TonB-dependent receptor [Granulicella sp. S156]